MYTLLTIDDDVDPQTSVPNPTLKIMIRMKRRERTIRIQKREKEKQRKIVPFTEGLPQGAQSRILPELEIPSRNLLLALRSLFISIFILFLLYIVVAVQHCPMNVLKEAQLLKRLFNCDLKEHSSVLNLNEYQRNLAEILCTDM